MNLTVSGMNSQQVSMTEHVQQVQLVQLQRKTFLRTDLNLGSDTINVSELKKVLFSISSNPLLDVPITLRGNDPRPRLFSRNPTIRPSRG